jgi:hypothetical protein
MKPWMPWVLLMALASGAGAQIPAALPAPGGAALVAKNPTQDVHRACVSCHKGHKGLLAGGPKAKLAQAKGGGRDQLCLTCHEGLAGAASSPGAVRMPILTPQGSGHVRNPFLSKRGDAYERVVRTPTRTLRLDQSCSGCHDPHGKQRGKLRATAFDPRGQLLDRAPMTVAEVCFGCHAGPEAASLPAGPADLGQLFGKGAASSHGIGATAERRPDLPSLRATVFRGAMDCTSCHDNPDPNGARGPHASPNPSLLKAPFGREKDMARLGERVNDLCYHCHDRQSILANQSFPWHAQHLSGFTGGGRASRPQSGGLAEAVAVLGIRSPRDLRPGRGGALQPGYGEPTPCATCHASHGSPRQASLIEFDRSVVSPSSVGGLSFQRFGLVQGSCTLSCHGYDHIQTRY